MHHLGHLWQYFPLMYIAYTQGPDKYCSIGNVMASSTVFTHIFNVPQFSNHIDPARRKLHHNTVYPRQQYGAFSQGHNKLCILQWILSHNTQMGSWKCFDYHIKQPNKHIKSIKKKKKGIYYLRAWSGLSLLGRTASCGCPRLPWLNKIVPNPTWSLYTNVTTPCSVLAMTSTQPVFPRWL